MQQWKGGIGNPNHHVSDNLTFCLVLFAVVLLTTA